MDGGQRCLPTGPIFSPLFYRIEHATFVSILRGTPAGTLLPKPFGRFSLVNARNIAFWVVLFLLILALFNLFSGSSESRRNNERTYSEFVSSVGIGDVTSVTLDGEQILYRTNDNVGLYHDQTRRCRGD